MPILKATTLTLLAITLAASPSRAAESLLLHGQLPIDASLLGASGQGVLQFQSNDEIHTVAAGELVRWSTPHINVDRVELLLADGTRLVLAAAWTGQQPWRIAGDTISATTHLLGKISLPRHQVRAVVLRAPVSGPQRARFFDQIRNPKDGRDSLRLTNNDHWTGELLGLAEAGDGRRQVEFALESTDKPLLVPEDRIAAIVFGRGDENPQQSRTLVVGLRDGSLLTATSLVADDSQLRVQLSCGVELNGADVRDVANLSSLASPCAYLSDFAKGDYLHEPYLEFSWSHRRDRNVLGGPLQVSGRTYTRGLGMPTAARLTYRLDGKDVSGRFRRFAASVAVDDAARRRGSVVFRVYLEHDGQWQQAYVSPVVRGGDEPVPVAVELGNARRIALVTDFADRGDECDYANWLDARLE